MLSAFAEHATAIGFRCVPEYGGHDLILVAGSDLLDPYENMSRNAIPHGVEPGDVIAIEGKLHATPTLLRQALPPHRRMYNTEKPAPCADFYAVVVPRYDGEFETVAQALDIGVVVMAPDRERDDNYGKSVIPAALDRWTMHDSYRVTGHPRIDVTGLNVKMRPGLPSPRSLSPWKIAAVRLCLLGQQRELQRADFAGTPVRLRTFSDRGWITLVRREGRHGVYALADVAGRPDLHYPEITAAIRAEAL